jgi:hypothetical protein
MSQLKNLINETFPRPRNWRWLASSPRPLYIKPVKSLGDDTRSLICSLVSSLREDLTCIFSGVEVTIYYLPAGQSLPPLEYPTGTVVLSKALFGVCEVKQMLGDPRGRSPMRCSYGHLSFQGQR